MEQKALKILNAERLTSDMRVELCIGENLLDPNLPLTYSMKTEIFKVFYAKKLI